MAAGEDGQPILIGRLSDDRHLARHAAFALFVQVYLEQAGLVPRRLVPQPADRGPRAVDRTDSRRLPSSRGADRELPAASELPELVTAIHARNPHVVAYFADADRRAALATLDAGATRELLGWLQAQRVEQEDAQVAYELGMLALGVELPAILVRGLREAPVRPDSRVVELPDGAGYPTIFLATLHPEWRAAARARLFVASVEAEQLAGWALLLLTGRLEPPPGSIVRVSPRDRAALQGVACDLALVYNPVPWLAAPEHYRTAVDAKHVLVL
jgi:hypothetical protein